MKEKVLRVVLVLFGALFLAGGIYSTYGMFADPKSSEGFGQMLASVYGVLGVFLMMAARNPSAERGLIGFTAWSSLVHGGVMAWQATHDIIPRSDLLQAATPMLVLGVLLLVLAPSRAKAAAA